MQRKARLSIENLEKRDVPTVFGVPWVSSDYLTVSFAPDGTSVDGSASSLFATMRKSGLTDAQWQSEILKAAHKWASVAQLNFGLVSDSGAAIGSAGAMQGDSRFGDIRIFARPLASDVLAITVPPGNASDTRTGDIILNSNVSWGKSTTGQKDIYTVLLQEFGHSLGVASSADPTSAMYVYYDGVATSLNADDISAVRELYSSRYFGFIQEGFNGNGSFSSATTISRPAGVSTTTTLSVIGDAQDASDDDFYKFTSPIGSGTLTVQLATAGISTFAGKITLYDANMVAIKSATTTIAGKNISISISSPKLGATYFVKVENGSSVFSSGSYKLRIISSSTSTVESTTIAGITTFNDNNTNDLVGSATRLYDITFDKITNYTVLGGLHDANDRDFLRVKTSAAQANQNVNLTAAIRYFNGSVQPVLAVHDLNGNTIPFQVVANGTGLYAVEAIGLQPSSEYLISVTQRAGVASGGSYAIDIVSRANVSNYVNVQSAELSNLTEDTRYSTLKINTTGDYSLSLGTLSPVNSGISAVTLMLFDSTGAEVLSLTGRSGDLVSKTVMLKAGTYSVVVCLTNCDDLFGMNFNFSIAGLSDPISVLPSDPYAEQKLIMPSFEWYEYDDSYYSWLEPTVEMSIYGL